MFDNLARQAALPDVLDHMAADGPEHLELVVHLRAAGNLPQSGAGAVDRGQASMVELGLFGQGAGCEEALKNLGFSGVINNILNVLQDLSLGIL